MVAVVILLSSGFLFAQRSEKPIAFNADSLSAGFQITKNMILGGLLLPQGATAKVYIDVTNAAGFAAGIWYQLQKNGADYYEQADSSSKFGVSFDPIKMKDWAFCRFRLDNDPADTLAGTYIERTLK